MCRVKQWNLFLQPPLVDSRNQGSSPGTGLDGNKAFWALFCSPQGSSTTFSKSLDNSVCMCVMWWVTVGSVGYVYGVVCCAVVGDGGEYRLYRWYGVVWWVTVGVLVMCACLGGKENV